MARKVRSAIYSVLWYCSLAAVAAGSATLGLWASDRTVPVRRISAEVVTSHVSRGGHIIISISVDRLRSCPSRIERWIVDANRYRHVLDDVDFAIAPGPLGHDTYRVRLDAPLSAATGPAVLRTNITSYCNPLHRLFPVQDGWELPIMID